MIRDYAPGQKVVKRFVTADSAGNKIAFSGTPTLRVIREDDFVITTPTGITLTLNTPATGRNKVVVDTSARPLEYLPGYTYTIEVLTGTVDGKDVVGWPIHQFTLGMNQVASFSDAAILQWVAHRLNSSFCGPLLGGSINTFVVAPNVYPANAFLEGFCVPLVGAGELRPGRICDAFDPVTGVGHVTPDFLTAVNATTTMLILPGGPVPTLNEMAVANRVELEAGNLDGTISGLQSVIDALQTFVNLKMGSVENNVPFEAAMRIILAVSMGKTSGFLSGTGGTGSIKSADVNLSGIVQGTKTRLQIDFDAVGNRLASRIIDITPT